MTSTMNNELETASQPDRLKRVVIEPLTRVEGHGKVSLLLDDDNHIHQARLHIVEFRGFEKFIQGRPYWELPVLVQRLCGICPVSHHLAAAKATDMLVGVTQISQSAEKIRKLMHFGQTLQSHALHFFHLSSPDLLFGYDDAVRHRNIVGVIEDHPEIAKKGVLLRKFGQEIIRLTAGKRVHGTGAIPGGVNKNLNSDERNYLLTDIKQIISWAQDAIDIIKTIYLNDINYNREFAAIESNMMSLVTPNGEHELYHGGLRAKDTQGNIIFDHLDTTHYEDYLLESIKSWSYMKFPFIKSLGAETGWYRVGPLARVNNCERFNTPLAEARRQEFLAQHSGGPIQATMASHWARMIELLHCTEAIEQLLHDDDLLGDDLLRKGDRQSRGIGVIEAPRGTLFHHYEIDDDGIVTKANLIVSTTNNNQAMNESIRQVANQYLQGNELTEPLLNQIEIAIRAYDPCLSCATHALGKMPLQIELLNPDGSIASQIVKRATGQIEQTCSMP